MRITHILFDLDGTLTDPKEGITKCVQYALRAFGIDERDLDALRRFIGPPLKESFMKYYGLSADDADRAIDKYRERFVVKGIFENRAYDGVADMLGRLRGAGKTLAIASSKPTVHVQRILEAYGLAPHFSCVVGSELDGRRTKKSEVIGEVFAQLGITDQNKSSAVMVGDREHDVAGARACGIDCVGVRFGYAEEGELEAAGAERIAGSIAELERFLME